VTRNMAQKIAGKNRGDYLKGRHWLRFARECGLGAPQVLARVRALTEAAAAQAEPAAAEVAAMPAGGHVVLDQTRKAIEQRARTLLAQLEEMEEDSSQQTERADVARGAEVADG